MLTDLAHGNLATERYVYLTTHGRGEGRSQTVELWFAAYHDTVYLLSSSGDRPEWVRNIARDPDVELRIGHDVRSGKGRVIDDPDEANRARRLVACKYAPQAPNGWGSGCLAVAVEVA